MGHQLESCDMNFSAPLGAVLSGFDQARTRRCILYFLVISVIVTVGVVIVAGPASEKAGKYRPRSMRHKGGGGAGAPRLDWRHGLRLAVLALMLTNFWLSTSATAWLSKLSRSMT